jgi:chromate transporter
MAVRPSVLKIFLVALRLGCTAFGGPVAHLAYFRDEYVRRRGWLDETHYADLVALCQFLPGPASSQTGFGIGYLQRGLAGGLAAWLGFTLPSAVLMIAFAYGVSTWGTLARHGGWLHGLKVAAVAVVAQAVWSMGKNLCPDWPRRALALATAAFALCLPSAWTQMILIALGATTGWLWFRHRIADDAAGHRQQDQPVSDSRDPVPSTFFARTGWLALFFVLLTALPLLAHFTSNPWLAVFDRFYRTGALVFGGGHAVLPLLEQEVVAPGWLTHDQFLAGYGAVQAMPGPLFTLSAYIGTVMNVGPNQSSGPGPHGWVGGIWALVAIFLPALLLVAGALPFWRTLRHRTGAQAALRGANAAVVGVLLAALYNPVWIAGITDRKSFAFALVAFAALQSGKIPVWLVVALMAAMGAAWL